MPACAHVFIVTSDVTDEFSQFFSYHIPSFLLVVVSPDPDFSCCVQYYVFLCVLFSLQWQIVVYMFVFRK